MARPEAFHAQIRNTHPSTGDFRIAAFPGGTQIILKFDTIAHTACEDWPLTFLHIWNYYIEKTIAAHPKIADYD